MIKAILILPRAIVLAAFLTVSLTFSPTQTPLSTTPVLADFGDPCSKYKKGSKKWKRCKKQTRLYEKPTTISNDDERFMAGYLLAKNGHYQEAIDVLSQIKDDNDPRVLNYIGFATRKLGNIEKALVYYRRAISIDPNYVMSRAYMGEAFLANGNRQAALHQLQEIENRCGSSCEAYVKLSRAIAGNSAL